MEKFRDKSYVTAVLSFAASLICTLLIILTPDMDKTAGNMLLIPAAAANLRLFADCGISLKQKTVDENFLPAAAAIIAAAAGSRACAAAVLAAASLTELIKKTITIYTGQEEGDTAGFRPSGKSAVTAAAASAVLTAAAAAVAAGSQGSVPGENTVIYWLTCWSSVMSALCAVPFSAADRVRLLRAVQRAAKDGIILRSARPLEKLSEIQTLIIEHDQIGTGEYKIADILSFSGPGEKEIRNLIGDKTPRGKNTKIVLNRGEKEYTLAPPSLINGQAGDEKTWKEARIHCEMMKRMGRKPMIMTEDGKLRAVVSFEEYIDPNAPEAMTMINTMGIRTVMVARRDRLIAEAAGRRAGASEVWTVRSAAGLREKTAHIREAGELTAAVGSDVRKVSAMGTDLTIGMGKTRGRGQVDIIMPDDDLLKVEKLLGDARRIGRAKRRARVWAALYDAAAALVFSGLLFPVTGQILPPEAGPAVFILFAIISLILPFRR